MKYNSKRKFIVLILTVIMFFSGCIFAHSGRTDSNGGHKDNQNKSGLGSYHYHCGGYSAHLHEGGVCPYKSTPKTSTPTNSVNNSNVTTNNNNTNTNTSSTEKKEEPTIIKTTKIEINETITNMKVGDKKQLTVTITPTDATDKNVKWESSNNYIATVSPTGEINALKSGIVNITVKNSDGQTDSVKITIEEVEQVKEVISSIENTKTENTTPEETDDAITSILGLGLVGGGAYLGYKKMKK